jgi:hypothetical protein
MKATEVLKKAKELLSIETEEVKLATATLENGTIVEAESFAAGQEVFIVTPDEKVALPVGDYTLEDGNVLMVKEEGIIDSIGAAQEEEEPSEESLNEETELEEDKEEMGYATKEELAEVKSMIEEIKAMIKDKEEMSEEVSEEEVKEELSEEIKEEESKEEIKEELSEIPKVKHNPEKEEDRNLNLFAQKRATTTYDRVLSKISKINQ